jgi:enoyl-CoA hydratase/carnithine racemase
MAADTDYSRLAVSTSGGIAWVTISNPPINLLDVPVMKELGRLGDALAKDASVRVVVVQSADPEFFLAHGDVSRIQKFPVGRQPPAYMLNGLHRVMERWRTLPQATIAKIAGRARGGGSEFALSLDMRFAARGKALLSQPEVALGILAGGSGTQRAARLMGRSRALEMLLGCADFDADLAEKYGYVNRALDPDELDGFVETLARRIASFPGEALACTKLAVDAALPSPYDGLMAEAALWDRAYSTAESQRRLAAFFEFGGQTRDGEMSWEPIVEGLARGA